MRHRVLPKGPAAAVPATHSFVVLGAALDAAEYREWRADVRATHQKFDPLWQMLPATKEEKQKFRSLLYQLLAAVLAADLGEVTGVRDPFKGRNHLGQLPEEHHQTCRKLVSYLIHKHKGHIPAMAASIDQWFAALPKDSNDVSLQEKLDSDVFVTELRTHLDVRFHSDTVDRVVPSTPPAVAVARELSPIDHYMLGLEARIDGKTEEMVSHFRKAADMKHAEAAWHLWEHYDAVAKDTAVPVAQQSASRADAEKYLDISAQGLYYPATRLISAQYQHDMRVPAYVTAFRKEAEAQDASAQTLYQMGCLYREINFREARYWLKKAIAKGGTYGEYAQLDWYNSCITHQDTPLEDRPSIEESLDYARRLKGSNPYALYSFAQMAANVVTLATHRGPLKSKDLALLKECTEAFKTLATKHPELAIATPSSHALRLQICPHVKLDSAELAESVHYMTEVAGYSTGSTGIGTGREYDSSAISRVTCSDPDTAQFFYSIDAVRLLEVHSIAKDKAKAAHWKSQREWLFAPEALYAQQTNEKLRSIRAGEVPFPTPALATPMAEGAAQEMRSPDVREKDIHDKAAINLQGLFQHKVTSACQITLSYKGQSPDDSTVIADISGTQHMSASEIRDTLKAAGIAYSCKEGSDKVSIHLTLGALKAGHRKYCVDNGLPIPPITAADIATVTPPTSWTALCSRRERHGKSACQLFTDMVSHRYDDYVATPSVVTYGEGVTDAEKSPLYATFQKALELVRQRDPEIYGYYKDYISRPTYTRVMLDSITGTKGFHIADTRKPASIVLCTHNDQTGVDLDGRGFYNGEHYSIADNRSVFVIAPGSSPERIAQSIKGQMISHHHWNDSCGKFHPAFWMVNGIHGDKTDFLAAKVPITTEEQYKQYRDAAFAACETVTDKCLKVYVAGRNQLVMTDSALRDIPPYVVALQPKIHFDNDVADIRQRDAGVIKFKKYGGQIMFTADCKPLTSSGERSADLHEISTKDPLGNFYLLLYYTDLGLKEARKALGKPNKTPEYRQKEWEFIVLVGTTMRKFPELYQFMDKLQAADRMLATQAAATSAKHDEWRRLPAHERDLTASNRYVEKVREGQPIRR